MVSWKAIMGVLSVVIVILIVVIIAVMLKPHKQSIIIEEKTDMVQSAPKVIPEEPPEIIIEDKPMEPQPAQVILPEKNNSLQDDSTEESSERIIEIFREKIKQPNITVSPGTTIIWVNRDDRIHEISGRGEDVFRNNSKRVVKRLLPGENFTWTFEEQGEYPYIDGVYGFHGTIFVK